MRKIINICLVLLSTLVILSCEENYTDPDASFSYVAFGGDTYSTGVDVGSNTTIDIDVYTSAIVSSDVTFNITVDGSGAAPGSFDVPSSVTVLGGTNKGSITVGLSDTNLGIGVNKLVLNFNDVAEGYDNGSSTTIEYIQNCDEVTLTLDLTFTDSWPEEAYWEIEDSLGGVVASVSEGTYAGMSSATETITLCGGRDFTFILRDGFGDGGHTYTLTFNGAVVAEVTEPYSYESSISAAFDTK